MPKKIITDLPPFEDFITTLQNINDYGIMKMDPEIATEVSTELEEKLKDHYIPALYESGDSLWETIKETKNTVTIHTTDSMATAVIPVYAFIITPKNIHDKMVLKSINIQQGTGYNNDLDEIYATYSKRNILGDFLTEIESTYIKEISKYIK